MCHPNLDLEGYWCSGSRRQYLAAEVGLWQAVPVHHIDQVVQHTVEDAVQLLAPQRGALDLRQGARVQLCLQTQQLRGTHPAVPPAVGATPRCPPLQAQRSGNAFG